LNREIHEAHENLAAKGAKGARQRELNNTETKAERRFSFGGSSSASPHFQISAGLGPPIKQPIKQDFTFKRHKSSLVKKVWN
jgi:hypothetical protein